MARNFSVKKILTLGSTHTVWKGTRGLVGSGGGCVISLRATWDRRGSLGVHLRQKQPKSVKKWLSYGYFPLRGCVISLRSSGTKGDPWVFICVKKIQRRSRNGLVTDIFPHRRCVISLRTTRDQRGSLGIHLCQKDPKICQEMAKLWLFSH